jgi:hypothetical protein
MEATFFDDEMIKANKTISCPICKTNHKVSLNDCHMSCEICGEDVSIELESSSDDFVWHPNLLF